MMFKATPVLLTRIISFKSKTPCPAVDLCDCLSLATSALLNAQQQLSPGEYTISLTVTDSQDRQCETPESLTLEVCQCDNRDICRSSNGNKDYERLDGKRPSGRLGSAAIGLLLLGLLLLLCEYAKPKFCF